MDMEAVDRIYAGVMAAIAGEAYEPTMIVLGAIHNTMALEVTTDETRLRSLYSMMADAAICMTLMEDDDNPQLPPEENTKQKKKTKKQRPKTGNGFGPSGTG